MPHFKFAAFSAALLLPTSAMAATVSTTTDATALASALLGSGVTINSATLTGAEGSAGTFSGFGGTGLGIDSGVILSSGNVSDAVGPNNSTSQTTNFGEAGDSDLDALGLGSTNDAVRLDIDFSTTSGEIFFEYAFASEEYNEFVGSIFNDVFALFLDGENIALLPGTTTVVSVNSVNNNANSEFYNDNESGAFDVEYDGFTDVLTAEGSGLNTPSHTLSFVVADVGDFSFDSAIFFGAGTLSSEPPNMDPPDPDVVPLPAGAWLLLTGFGALGLARRRQKKS